MATEAGACTVCGGPEDSGRHDSWQTCEDTRGPCLDRASHHEFREAVTDSRNLVIAMLQVQRDAAREALRELHERAKRHRCDAPDQDAYPIGDCGPDCFVERALRT